MTLFFYNVGLLAALVAGAPWWLWRMATTQKYREGLRERLGRVPKRLIAGAGAGGRPLIWLHVPAALWGAAVEFGGWICPITLLENRLRSAAGEATYSGDCIAHYMNVMLYPSALTRSMQVLLGVLVLAMNVGVYRLLWRRARHAALAQ